MGVLPLSGRQQPVGVRGYGSDLATGGEGAPDTFSFFGGTRGGAGWIARRNDVRHCFCYRVESILLGHDTG